MIARELSPSLDHVVNVDNGEMSMFSDGFPTRKYQIYPSRYCKSAGTTQLLGKPLIGISKSE